jgi:hypothetical protein
MLGAPGHACCADNMHDALTEIGLAGDAVPQPVNMFMNVPVSTEGDLSWLPAVSRPGNAVTFAAAMGSVHSGCKQWCASRLGKLERGAVPRLISSPSVTECRDCAGAPCDYFSEHFHRTAFS